MTAEQEKRARKQRADRLHELVEGLTHKQPVPAKEGHDDKSCEPAETPREFIKRRMTELDD
jgi:hypothetical protein